MFEKSLEIGVISKNDCEIGVQKYLHRIDAHCFSAPDVAAWRYTYSGHIKISRGELIPSHE